MNNEIYLVFKKDNKIIDCKGKEMDSLIPLGSVYYNELKNKLVLVINNNRETEFNNIIEVIQYIEKNNWLLCDMEGYHYDLKTHMDLVNNINKIGYGYVLF